MDAAVLASPPPPRPPPPKTSLSSLSHRQSHCCVLSICVAPPRLCFSHQYKAPHPPHTHTRTHAQTVRKTVSWPSPMVCVWGRSLSSLPQSTLGNCSASSSGISWAPLRTCCCHVIGRRQPHTEGVHWRPPSASNHMDVADGGRPAA